MAIAGEQPAWGQRRVANERARQGVSISPAGGVWQRHDLEDHEQTAQGAGGSGCRVGHHPHRGATGGLGKSQDRQRSPWRIRERARQGARSAICPGCCGAQDTVYVGTMKGVGRIYQQTFIDTYAKVGFACPSGDAQRQAL